MKTCKDCDTEYDLKESGRYCPGCGRDWWDGVCGMPKKLNKKELKVNNRKYKKMKSIKEALLSIMVLMSVGLNAQIYPDEIQESDSTYSFLSTADGTVYDHVELEIRNDSICIEGGGCIVHVPGLGVEAHSIDYNTTTKGFDVVTNTDGTLINQFIPFLVTHNKVTLSMPAIQIEEVDNEVWESEAYASKIFRVDNHIDVDSIDVDTRRLKIGWVDAFGITTTYHDSVDISYATGETFDSTHIYAALVDTASAIRGDMPSSIWTENGSDIYYNSGSVGIGTNSPDTELHVIGRMFISGTGGVFIGNGVGNESNTGALNLGFGDNNLLSLTTGSNNLSFGSNSMRNTTTGEKNVSIGNSSQYNGNGSYNVTLGSSAGYALSGVGNFAVGRSTLDANTSGNYNNIVGYQAFTRNTTGSNNTGIGFRSGYNNLTGTGNILIGHQSGYNETGSNKLYIENSTSSSPLIYGDFSTNEVFINGTLGYSTQGGTANDLVALDTDGKFTTTSVSSLLFSELYTDLDFTGTTGLSDGIDDVDDADNDPTNELFDSTYIYSALIDTAAQIRSDFPTVFSGIYTDLDFTGTTGMSDGIDNVDDADNNITNEIQTIDVFQLVGTVLQGSLSSDGESTKTVELSSLKDNLGNHTASQDIQLNGNWISNDIATSEGISIDNSGNVTMSGDLDVNGKVTVGDNVEGNAVNIAGYDSENDLTRVSIGSNLALSSGTLSAPQSFASSYMNPADIDNSTYVGSTYYNLSLGTVRYSIGNVTANTSLEQFEIDETAYYQIIITGSADSSDGGCASGLLDFYAKEGATYDFLGSLQVEDCDDQEFTIIQSLLLLDGDDIIIAAKHPASGQGDVQLYSFQVDIVKM